jgi:hypothetical protein
MDVRRRHSIYSVTNTGMRQRVGWIYEASWRGSTVRSSVIFNLNIKLQIYIPSLTFGTSPRQFLLKFSVRELLLVYLSAQGLYQIWHTVGSRRFIKTSVSRICVNEIVSTFRRIRFVTNSQSRRLEYSARPLQEPQILSVPLVCACWIKAESH